MPRSATTAILLAAALASPAFGKVEIRDIKPMHGPLGPERASYDLHPGDELFIGYTVSGLGTDERGMVNLETTMHVVAADDRVLLNETSPTKSILALGGGTAPGLARLALNLNFKPGNYIIKITVNDKLRQESASFQRTMKVQPVEFAAVRLRFAYDEKGQIPAPAGGTLGQVLHFSVHVIGFDKSQGKMRINMNVQLLDAKGQELMPTPLNVNLATDATFRANLALFRVGTFTLRLTFTDEITQKQVSMEVPLKVAAR